MPVEVSGSHPIPSAAHFPGDDVAIVCGHRQGLLPIHDEFDLVAIWILDERVAQFHRTIAVRPTHEGAAAST